MASIPAAADPVAALESAAWALAAVIEVQRDAASSSLQEALTASPARSAVLEAAGLARREGGAIVPGPALHEGGAARDAAAARLRTLRELVEVATGEEPTPWAQQPDSVLIDQGRASAVTGQALAKRVAPALAGLAERLRAPGAQVLDVGTGIGALAAALAEALPAVHVTGIDVLPRAIRLARAELAGADRVTVREQDVADLREHDRFDLVWLPAPFLAAEALAASLPHVIESLTPGGWLVVGTDPAPADALARAVSGWRAARGGGSAVDSDSMAGTLQEIGLQSVAQLPTFPGGPVLVVAQRS